MLGLMSITMLASCSDDDDFVPGKPAGELTISFANEENLALAMDATEFTVDLVRSDETSLAELTVPINVLGAPEFLDIPASVTFPQGSTETSFTVKIGEGMEPFTDYNMVLAIDESYTNPYAENSGSPRYNITLVKEDYELYATGMFHETVLFKSAWEVEIQYSMIRDMYRIKDAIMPGTHWYFKWNGPDAEEQEFYFTDKIGNEASCSVRTTQYYGWFCGYTHQMYGQVYATVIEDEFIGFDPNDPDVGASFWFLLQYLVDTGSGIGSFGANYEWIDELVFAN